MDSRTLFLQNNGQFAKIGILASPEGGELLERERAVLQGATTIGAYDRVGEHLVGVFRHEGTLYLLVDRLSYPWSEVLSVNLEDQSDGKRHFCVILTESRRVAFDYPRLRLNPPLSAIYEPFSEEEDYEFCLFIRNIAANKDRRERVFRENPYRP